VLKIREENPRMRGPLILKMFKKPEREDITEKEPPNTGFECFNR
jgi:hypothetical protein